MTLDRRLWFAYFAALALGCTAIAAWGTILRPGSYKLLDWAINYEGGFTRRGLTGQIALEIAQLTGVSIAVQVFVLVSLLYAVILASVYRLWQRGDHDGRFTLLLAAPWFLLFPIVSHHGAGRKELLFLAGFALLCLSVSRNLPASATRNRLALFILTLPLISLAHEGNAFFLGLPLALGLALDLPKRSIGILAMATLPTIVLLGWLSLAPPLATASIQAICASLVGPLGAPALALDCAVTENAVTWLGNTASHATAAVRLHLPDYLHSLGPALILIALAFVPLRDLIKSHRAALIRGVVLSTLCVVPLWFVAVDWGRFLYVIASCHALILLTLRARAPHAAPAPQGRVTTAAYALLWNLGYLAPLVGGGLVAKTLALSSPLYDP